MHKTISHKTYCGMRSESVINFEMCCASELKNLDKTRVALAN